MSVPRQGPLAGVKVIELCHVMAGPTCGLFLADMGADVIKVEKMDGGDQTRQSVPPAIAGESAAYMMMNRNKRGVVIDLKKEGGRRALKRLLEKADIVTENYRADTMPRLGMGYDEIRKVNPGIIYASISGFGRTGPYAERGGFDLVAQGMSGLMSITGEGPGRPPVKVGAPVCDITAGMLLAMGILAAYAHRLKTGEGQVVDTSLFEAGISHTYWQSAIAFATGVAPAAMGSAHPLNAPYQAYRTQDGYINLGAANAKNWKIMLEAIGAPELADDPRFRTNGDRMANLGPLQEALEKVFTTRPSRHWLDLMERVGVPAGPIYDVIQMHNDPQTVAREMVVEVEHARAGRVKTIGLPIKFSETPGKVAAGAPLFGQHTREVLLEHGFTPAEVARLAEEKAILLGDEFKAAAE
jgi:crotonobetainyl-CoA:carnitine CoA-transferase CaiB-like acyl-CoA transferase